MRGARLTDRPPRSARAGSAALPRNAWIRGLGAWLFACGLCVTGVAQTQNADDLYASDPALRRFVESLHGDAYAMDLGRIAYRKRWETTLTEGLYLIAPRGTWNESHPAWKPAREALADALRRAAVPLMTARKADIRRLMNQSCMLALTADERRDATAFFESRAGRMFMNARALSAHTDAYDVPPGLETMPLAAMRAQSDAALDTLDPASLPEDRGDGKLLNDFLESPLWKKILRLQIEQWADHAAFFLNHDIDEALLNDRVAIAATLRVAVPTIPPASQKTYLGSVTMRPDRSFSVIVDHYIGLNRMARFPLAYAPSDLHWNDIAALVPGIRAGESRTLYFDAQGHVSDKP